MTEYASFRPTIIGGWLLPSNWSLNKDKRPHPKGQRNWRGPVYRIFLRNRKGRMCREEVFYRDSLKSILNTRSATNNSSKCTLNIVGFLH